MNKKIAIPALAVIVFAAIYVNRDLFIDDTTQATTSAAGTGFTPSQTQGAAAPLSQPITQERAQIAQSVTDVAAQLVELAPNRSEALIAAAEAQSLRVQRLRAQRMAEAAKEAEATYNAALFRKKTELAGQEAQQALGGNQDSAMRDHDLHRSGYTLPLHSQQIQHNAREQKQEERSEIPYSLHGIRETDSGRRAVLRSGGSDFLVSAGQALPDGTRVVSIEPRFVALKKGDNTLDLYVF